jgi:hypothetical protein
VKVKLSLFSIMLNLIPVAYRGGGAGGGGGRPGRRREGGAKMGIKAQGPGNDFFNRPTRAGWDHCQCHEVHVS